MVMEIKFQPQGVCSKQIVIDVEDGIVNNVKFMSWKVFINNFQNSLKIFIQE